MFYHRKGYPEESEIVMCVVIKVHYNSVFVKLTEYDKQGMIHISEISPGRIRNIRDYVKEGKIIVCKVLRVNQEKGYIDLSLRRVNENQRREKVNQIKQEQKAEKIIEFVAQQNNMNPKELYDKIARVVLKDYEFIHHFFEDVVAGNESLDILKLGQKLKKQLEEVIKQRIKPKVYTKKAIAALSSYDSDGIEKIRKALEEIEKKGSEIHYLGAGRYSIKISGEDAKALNKKMGSIRESLENFFSENGKCEFNIVES